jgi:hypothetical protein
MLDDTGARLQESLRQKPAMEGMRAFPYPLQGIIEKVYFKDSASNQLLQTVVDVIPFGGYSKLLKVPLMAQKVNMNAGEEWTPEEGDFVIVMFINGMWTSPIVTGYCNPPSNEIMATEAQVPKGKRRYHMRCNKTDIMIDKDGNRITAVEKDDTTHIKGNQTDTVDGKRTTIIEGNDEVTVNSGDLKITVAAGKCTVSIAGKTAWESNGGIDLDGGSGSTKGVVQGGCLCAFTGAPHGQFSATVKASI